ncbi:MAG: hypothetical protein K2F77_00485 [Muribaculaceae bacterium]|nr:hypothetical protein [Muribaculaceae bacterium]
MTLTKRGATDLTLQYNPTLDAAISVNDLTVNSRIYPNHNYDLAVNLTNITDSDFEGSIGTAFFPAGDSEVTIADIQVWGAFNGVVIPAGETLTINLQPYCDLTAAPGKYRLGILTEDFNILGDLTEVEILANANTTAHKLRCNDVDIADVAAVDRNNISISGKLFCEEGSFTGQIGFSIYEPLSKTLMGTLKANNDVALDKGESATIKVNGALPHLTA